MRYTKDNINPLLNSMPTFRKLTRLGCVLGIVVFLIVTEVIDA